jgi:hypothetical protein
MHSMFLSSLDDPQVLTALTASTQLTGLAVTAGDPEQDQPSEGLPLPKGALQQMFSPPKQWPSLQASEPLCEAA